MTVHWGDESASRLCRALEANRVRVAFGLPGTQNHALFSALRGSAIRTIVPTHELAAAFMAGAYGRVTGEPGVLLTIPGPGFAYALPGLAEAWLDSAPVIHITHAAPVGSPLKLQHQALDQRAIARPLVKAIVPASADRVEEAVRAAWECAVAGEPGPVTLELAESATAVPRDSQPRRDPESALRIWQRVAAARRPLLILGQGAARASEQLADFVARTTIPFITTASGRGVVSEASPLCLGYDSLRQPPNELNALIASADAILVVGARLAYNGSAGFGLVLPASQLMRIDTDAEAGHCGYPAALSATMAAEEFMAMPESAHVPVSAWSSEEISTSRARLSRVSIAEPEPKIVGLSPEAFFRQLRAALPDDTILTTDSGLHQVLVRRYFEVRAVHGLVMPTDLQSMGFGLPAAIAAKLAQPARPVVALIGDGGALMSGLELATAVRERIALTVLVCNDGYLNQIRLGQLADAGWSHGVKVPAIDFEALALAVGAGYLRLESGDLSSLRELSMKDVVTLVDVPVGDSAAIWRTAAAARAKSLARAALGSRLTALAKRWRRR